MLNGLNRNVTAPASTLLTPLQKPNVQITSALAATNRETSVTFLSVDAAHVNGPRETFTDNRGYRILTSFHRFHRTRTLTILPKHIS